jgi:rhamnogalacturonyl hydrolase YesR
VSNSREKVRVDLEAAFSRLDRWLQDHDYRAYDPFDGLNSWVRPLAVGRLGRQLLQQGVRQFPVNLRPLLGVRPAHSSKGFGYLARGYLRRFRATGDGQYRDRAVHALAWLEGHGSRAYGGISWGNHFDYQSRVFYLPKGTPTIVWVSHIGQAFLDAWEATGDRRYLSVAEDTAIFIMTGLERRPDGRGVCLSYIPGQYKAVHNANVLGAALLARVAKHSEHQDWVDVAAAAIDYTVGAQRPDGSWWYGEADDLHWVDNFHTGYVLDSLWCYMEATADTRYESEFARGADFFLKNFFLEDGTPKYYANRTYPIDIQCASQAIESLVLLGRVRRDPSILALARKVAEWTVTNMQDESGFFYFRRLPFAINRTPTLHWGQATMLNALATLILDESQNGH